MSEIDCEEEKSTKGEKTSSSEQLVKSCVDLPIQDEVLSDVISKAKDYALMHGVGFRRQKDNLSESSVQVNYIPHAPFLLLPSTFPKLEFEKAVEIQPTLNEMMFAIAKHPTFLTETLSKTILVDEFTRKLFDIYKYVRDEGMAQKKALTLFRADYFHCTLNESIKQVEVNTIASSLPGLSSSVWNLQKYVLNEMNRFDLVDKLPPNEALENMTSAMIQAVDLYNCPGSVILFIVEDVTYNICDQRLMEFAIREKRPDIKVLRLTLTQVEDEAKLTEDSFRRLLVRNLEVALVYFRSGYSPVQYPTEKEWSGRLKIERSYAMKCPSIAFHLAGTKKVQQVLATTFSSKENHLKTFLKDDVLKVERVRDTFAGLYSLDDSNENLESTLQKVRQSPENFVLKPQREGGGNNVYGKEILEKLKEILDSQERHAYILMDRIQPPISQNYVVRPDDECHASLPKLEKVTSELGIFGCLIGDETTDEILLNTYAGHMLRTKLSDVNEGGVAAGQGALDSVILVDEIL